MHVVLHHYLITVPGYRASAPDWLRRLMDAGPSSVGLFFVLSGFILTYNYMRPDGSLRVEKKEFWGARFARVYPIYLLGLVVYVPIAVARYASGTGLSVVDVGPGPAFAVSGILTLLLLQTWTVVFLAWNGPCWSVSAEAFFYSLFSWAAPYIMSLSRRRMLWAMAAVWVFSLIGPAWFLIAILGHTGKQTKELWEMTLTFHPLLRSVPFLIGIATGVLFLRNRGDAPPHCSALTIGSAAAILIAGASVPFEAERLLENCLTPLFALLLYLLAFERGALYALLSHPFTVLLGEASYALYILHNPVWNYLARLQNIVLIVWYRHFPVGPAKPGIQTEWNYDMNGWMFCLYLFLLTGVSILALRYIEQPARAFLRRYFSERKPWLARAQFSGSAP